MPQTAEQRGDWYRAFVAKHGCSPTTVWRRHNPKKNAKLRKKVMIRYRESAEARELHRLAMMRHRHKLKRETFGRYGGAFCACCGEDEWVFLTLDHVNNDGANDRRARTKKGQAGIPFYAALKRAGWPGGYQVLCMNCNFGREHNMGVCPHKRSASV